MARPKSQYVCQACGAVQGKWAGRCDDCGAWNTIVEEAAGEAPPKSLGATKGRALALSTLADQASPVARIPTGIDELDRVLGGGLVAGSAVLIGGDPGIGKSTLLLQAAANLSNAGRTMVYVSGEESEGQIQLRAGRLGLGASPVALAAATSVRSIVATLEEHRDTAAVVIDSIQTMFLDTLESAPGTVAQVRASAQELIRFAKRRQITLPAPDQRPLRRLATHH